MTRAELKMLNRVGYEVLARCPTPKEYTEAEWRKIVVWTVEQTWSPQSTETEEHLAAIVCKQLVKNQHRDALWAKL